MGESRSLNKGKGCCNRPFHVACAAYLGTVTPPLHCSRSLLTLEYVSHSLHLSDIALATEDDIQPVFTCKGGSGAEALSWLVLQEHL